jgi:molybdenum cofactor cytidylyltransferase
VFPCIVAASVEKEAVRAVYERTAGIILAAGESKRFGRPKQLLEWKGQSFVQAVARTAINAGLSPVIVVSGANAEDVETSVSGLGVEVIRNVEWTSGQASSIKKAVKSLSPEIGGAVFLLSDQPQVSVEVIQALIEKHSQGIRPIIAPMVMDRRANPVLFDKDTFKDLLLLEGDTGGRAIFHKYRVDYLPWHDDSLLLDVDTPEQYQKLISLEDL